MAAGKSKADQAHELAVQDREKQKIIAKLSEGRQIEEGILVENVRARLTRSVHDLVEAGKELVLLQNIWGYGNFTEKVEKELKIPHSTAYRLMNAAINSLKFPVLTNFSHVGKVYALIEAPQEELEKFEQTGVFAGKTVDQLELLPKTELVGMVREMKANKKDKKTAETRQIDNLNKQIEKLQKENERLAQGLPTDDEEAMEKAIYVELLKVDAALNMLSTAEVDGLSPRIMAKVIGAYEYAYKRCYLAMLEAKERLDPTEEITGGEFDLAEKTKVRGGIEKMMRG